MVTKTIRINVEKQEVEILNSELEKTRTGLDKVEGATQKTKSKFQELGTSQRTIQKLDTLTGGWASSIVDVGAGLKDVVKGINLSRTALIATGIGAFVVLLGTVVAYWDDIKNYVSGVNVELEEQKRITDEINLALERRNQLESDNARFMDVQTKERLLRAKAAGASEEELTEIQRNGLEQRLMLAEQYAKEADRIFQESLGADQDAFDKAQKNQIKAYDDLAKARTALGFFNLESEIPGKEKSSSNKRQKESKVNPLTGAEYDAEIERLTEFFNTTFELDKANRDALQESANTANEQFLNSELVAQAERTRIQEAQSKYREWLADQEAQAKVQSYMLAANGFAAASELIGRETAAGKAFAVASTLASTYLAAQQAYASQLTIPTPDAPARAAIAAATAVVSGLANVKNILAVKVPGQGGGGGSFGGGTPARPPAFNVVGNNPQNQLNQSLLEQNNQPVQAFVVDKNVTTGQELRRNKIGASSL